MKMLSLLVGFTAYNAKVDRLLLKTMPVETAVGARKLATKLYLFANALATTRSTHENCNALSRVPMATACHGDNAFHLTP